MKENKVAENVLGTIGAVLWTIQVLPQIVKSYRTKSTEGLSAALMLIWAIASLFLGSYIVAQRLSIPLQIQPQLFGFLSAVSWCQCLYYSHGWSRRRVGITLLAFCLIFGGFEGVSVWALWQGQDRGITWPIKMYGIITAVLLAVALLPQYYEIYRLRQVIGISLIFMAVDILGGVFSFSSLFVRADLDIIAFISYALVVILDGIVVVLALVLNPIAKRHAQARDAEAGLEVNLDSEGDVSPSRSEQPGSDPARTPQDKVPNISTLGTKETASPLEAGKGHGDHDHEFAHGLGRVHSGHHETEDVAPMHFRTISHTSR